MSKFVNLEEKMQMTHPAKPLKLIPKNLEQQPPPLFHTPIN